MTIDPAAQERARIVAWLRDQHRRKGRDSAKPTSRQAEIACLAMQGAYGFAADAIERGDHTHDR